MSLFKFDPDFRRPNITADELRDKVRTWKARNGWSAEDITKALFHECGPNARTSSTTINDWVTGRRTPRRDLFRYFRIFMERYPNPGSFKEWLAQHDSGKVPDIFAEEAAIEELRAKVERDRQEYVRKCLEAERKPQRSSTPRGIIPPAWYRTGGKGDHHV